MKYTLLPFLLIGFFANMTLAQVATLKIMDAETHENIPGVVAHSRAEKNLDNHLRTDNSGTIQIHIAKNDTISLEMKGYYPLHLVVTHFEAYEFAHPVTVYMTPLMHHTHHTSITDYSSLNAFEYHFVHDDLEDKQFKLNVLEHTNATSKRNQWLSTTRNRHGKDFNIVVIKLPETKK